LFIIFGVAGSAGVLAVGGALLVVATGKDGEFPGLGWAVKKYVADTAISTSTATYESLIPERDWLASASSSAAFSIRFCTVLYLANIRPQASHSFVVEA
jgi:hypothetical protein